jgi:hypothetical protein
MLFPPLDLKVFIYTIYMYTRILPDVENIDKGSIINIIIHFVINNDLIERFGILKTSYQIKLTMYLVEETKWIYKR